MAMSTESADQGLEAKGVTVAFAGLVALQDVAVRLRGGEILGLIGANGAGKTTFVNVITGYQRCQSGSITLDGEEISHLSPEERARRGLARTFQAGRLFRRLTVEENLEAAAFGVGLKRRAARKRTDEVLALTGLAPLRDIRAGSLPYGEERRVALARALTIRPRFLAVDEPAAGMNESESEQLLELVAQMRDRDGIGILMIEHDVGLIMRLCDRVQVLAEGSTICVGTPDEVQRDPAVISSYLGTRKVTVDA